MRILISIVRDNLYRAIYLSGILQFIALVGSFLAIVKLVKYVHCMKFCYAR